MNNAEWDLVFERDPVFVLDTCILVSALRSRRGASHYLLNRTLDGALPIAISTALLYEYEEVLLRPDNMAPNATHQDILSIIDGLLEVAKPVAIDYLHRPSIRDADDEFVFEAAYSARAIIITHNEKDFLGCERLGVRTVPPGDVAKWLGLQAKAAGRE